MKLIIHKVLVMLLALQLLSCDDSSKNMLESEDVTGFENKNSSHAREITQMPFDNDCTSICFYMRGGGLQDLTMLAKFTCAEDDANEIIKRFVAWNDKQIGRPGERSVSEKPPYTLDILPSKEVEKVKWWTLTRDTIRKEIRCTEGFGCSFWVAGDPDGDSVEVYMFQGS